MLLRNLYVIKNLSTSANQSKILQNIEITVKARGIYLQAKITTVPLILSIVAPSISATTITAFHPLPLFKQNLIFFIKFFINALSSSICSYRSVDQIAVSISFTLGCLLPTSLSLLVSGPIASICSIKSSKRCSKHQIL